MADEESTSPHTNEGDQSANIWRSSLGGRFKPGARIGAYVIQSHIGQGGFGDVYLAEQTAPVKRQVALKIIKAGMDSQAVISRFEAERQALAVMDHPHVAKVFDGGALPPAQGARPYFVMEFVDGLPLTTYCDKHNLSIEARIDLFMRACEAVQHAHMKGLIHRDLKPANVLVEERNGKPTPKVIDFGVAKALSPSMTERVIHTQAGELIGTPEYMSPEQADAAGDTGSNGPDIDTRSDIYSLGVMLYELLTGAVPFDARTLLASGYSGLHRIIREVDPPKPSTRVMQHAGNRQSRHGCLPARVRGRAAVAPRRTDGNRAEAANAESPAPDAERPTPSATGPPWRDRRTLVRRLRGDLDWIVMKCLEKDRNHRYETAAALAEDLRRYRNNEPVLAGPPSTLYRLRKFVRRNRTGVMAGSAVAVMLVLLTGLSIIFAIHSIEQERITKLQRDRAVAAERRAEEEAAIAERQTEVAIAVNEFLTDDLLSAVSPERLGREVSMRDVLDAAAEQLELRTAPGERFDGMPEIEAEIRHALGTTYYHLGEYEQARRHIEREVAVLRDAMGEGERRILKAIHTLGMICRAMGEYELAEQHIDTALNGFRAIHGEDHEDTLDAVGNMAALLRSQGRLDQAEPYYRAALDGCRRLLGEDDPKTLVAINNMGGLLRARGRLDEAEQFYREAMNGFRRIYGDDHPSTLTAINNMAGLLRAQRRLDEAEAYYLEALEGRRRVLSDDHPRTLASINNMGHLLQSRGKLKDAEAYFREALEGLRRTVGEDHPDTLNAMQTMGHNLRAQGNLDRAEQYFSEALEKMRRVLGNEHHDTLSAVAMMGQLLRARGEPELAEPYYREAAEGLRDALGNEHTRTLTAISNLGFLLRTQDRFDEAEPLYREVFETRRAMLGRDHTQTLQSQHLLGALLRQMGRLDDAEAMLRDGAMVAKESLGMAHQRTGDLIAALGETLIELGRRDEAKDALTEATTILAAALGDDHDSTIAAKELLVTLDNSP